MFVPNQALAGRFWSQKGDLITAIRRQGRPSHGRPWRATWWHDANAVLAHRAIGCGADGPRIAAAMPAGFQHADTGRRTNHLAIVADFVAWVDAGDVHQRQGEAVARFDILVRIARPAFSWLVPGSAA